VSPRSCKIGWIHFLARCKRRPEPDFSFSGFVLHMLVFISCCLGFVVIFVLLVLAKCLVSCFFMTNWVSPAPGSVCDNVRHFSWLPDGRHSVNLCQPCPTPLVCVTVYCKCSSANDMSELLSVATKYTVSLKKRTATNNMT